MNSNQIILLTLISQVPPNNPPKAHLNTRETKEKHQQILNNWKRSQEEFAKIQKKDCKATKQHSQNSLPVQLMKKTLKQPQK